MKLKVKDKNDGTWFDYPGSKVRMQIRRIPLGVAMDLRAKVSKKIALPLQDPTPGAPSFIVDSEPDPGDLSWVIFDYMLQDWAEIEPETEGSEPATKEDIKKAIFDHDGLRKFVTDKSNELTELHKKVEESDAKNAPSSQNGSKKEDVKSGGVKSVESSGLNKA